MTVCVSSVYLGCCKFGWKDSPQQDLLRHVARLRRLGAVKFLGGGAIVTDKCTQLTMTVTDSATITRIRVKLRLNNAASERRLYL